MAKPGPKPDRFGRYRVRLGGGGPKVRADIHDAIQAWRKLGLSYGTILETMFDFCWQHQREFGRMLENSKKRKKTE